MSHQCAPSNFTWYLGKFFIGFAGLLFLYISFLKENETSCMCDVRMRELLRQESEKQPGRCECAKGTRSERYACGCNKMKPIIQLPPPTEYISHSCARSRCCMRRNSY